MKDAVAFARRRRRGSQRRFRKRLQGLGYRSYGEYLQSAHWRDLKARYRRSKLRQHCWRCASRDTQLHHQTYERLGNERLGDLVPLCGECHRFLHQLEAEGRVELDGQPPPPIRPDPPPMPPLDTHLEFWWGGRHSNLSAKAKARRDGKGGHGPTRESRS